MSADDKPSSPPKGQHPTPMLDQLEDRAVAELRHRAQASARRRRQAIRADDERPARAARAFLRGAPRLLEGRHGLGVRLRRRRHPALLRSRRAISGLEGIPHAARPAAGGLPLHDRPPAQALRHLGKARLRPHRLPRPERRHHVPGLHDRKRAEGVRRPQRDRLRSRRRRPGAAHLDELRRPRALRDVLLRRGQGASLDASTRSSTRCIVRRCPTSSSSSSPAAATIASTRSIAPTSP